MPTRTISYDPRAVTINGKRQLLLSAAFHYPRSTPAMWQSMMQSAKADGINTIETYAFWNLHEPQRGKFDFSDNLDVRLFCEIAQDNDLDVIMRIGPYICAETNYGGFPSWLREVPGLKTRTLNEPFMREMAQWVRHFCGYLDGLFAPQGGPIIMSQIENEYELISKTYGDEGQRYLAWSIEFAQSLNLGVPWVMCFGGMPGAIETINGFYGHQRIDAHYVKHQSKLPAIWTENWTGWYDTWGYPHHKRSAEDEAYAVSSFIARGGTGVNYYMWHGGTNFDRSAMYLQTTSYDYDAPLDEYGLPTTKSNHLGALNHTLLRYADVLLNAGRAQPQPLGEKQNAYAYAHGGRDLTFLCNDDVNAARVEHNGKRHTLAPHSALLLSNGRVVFNTTQVKPEHVIQRSYRSIRQTLSWQSWSEPMPHERTDGIITKSPLEQLQFTGDMSDYCWYSTTLNISKKNAGKGTLTLRGIADVAHVFVNGKLSATTQMPILEERGDLSSIHFSQTHTLNLDMGEHRLDILCCAVGLIKGDWMLDTQNMVEERKGFWGDAHWNRTKLTGKWTMYPFLLGEQMGLPLDLPNATWLDAAQTDAQAPRWWRAQFTRPKNVQALALDLRGMSKGVAWLNGRCIGRFWLTTAHAENHPFILANPHIQFASIGEPTQRYYHLPIEWLDDVNTLVLVDELGASPADVRLCAWK